MQNEAISVSEVLRIVIPFFLNSLNFSAALIARIHAKAVNRLRRKGDQPARRQTCPCRADAVGIGGKGFRRMMFHRSDAAFLLSLGSGQRIVADIQAVKAVGLPCQGGPIRKTRK